MEILVPVVVAVTYMEELENEAMDTTLQDTRPSMWRWCINDSFEVVKQDK